MLIHCSIDEYIHTIEKSSIRGKTKDTFLDTNMFNPLAYDNGEEIVLDKRAAIENILHKYPGEYQIILKQVESLHQKLGKLMSHSSVGISPTVAEELFGPKKLASYKTNKNGNRQRDIQRKKKNMQNRYHAYKENTIHQQRDNIINTSITAKRHIVNNNRTSLEAFMQTGGWTYYKIEQGLHESYLLLSKHIGKIPTNDDKIFFEIFKYATTQGRPINFFTRDTDFLTLVRKTFDPIQKVYAPTDFEINMYLYSKQECIHLIKFEYTQRTRILEMKDLAKISQQKKSEKIYAHQRITSA